LLGWGCGVIQFPFTMIGSKHHNLTFHSGCNVLYHPSISSIAPLIWFSFIHIQPFPKTPNPIFHFFLISVSIETQSNAGKACMLREIQSNEVLRFLFLFYNIVSPFISLWSYLPCIPPHCPTFFFSFILIFFCYLIHYYFLVVMTLQLLQLKSKTQGLGFPSSRYGIVIWFSFLHATLPFCLICFFNIKVLIFDF
jgi:hypothetical protein